MKTSSMQRESKNSCEEARPLQVTLLYEGEIALKEARKTVKAVADERKVCAETQIDEFSFAEVKHPELLNETVQLARDSDILVVSVENGICLPLEVSSWLDTWLKARPNKATALVSLVGRGGYGTGSPPVEEQLREIALKNELAFFANSYFSAVAPAIAPIATTPRWSEVNYLPPPERWGLNE